MKVLAWPVFTLWEIYSIIKFPNSFERPYADVNFANNYYTSWRLEVQHAVLSVGFVSFIQGH